MIIAKLAACLAIAAFPTTRAKIAGDDENLRYSLAPGREWIYHSESTDDEKGGSTYIVDWKIWSIGREPDGSWKLIIRCDLEVDRGRKDGQPAGPADTLIWRCRMTEDGIFSGADTMGNVRDPFRLFPKLPANTNEQEQGWSSSGSPEEGMTLRHSIATDAKAGTGKICIATRAEGPQNEVYDSSHEYRAIFDIVRGVVVRIETEDSSKHLSPGVTRGVTELISVEDRGEGWAARFGREANAYFDAVDAYETAFAKATRNAAECDKILAGAKSDLEKAKETLSEADFLKPLGRKLEDHDRFAEYATEEATERAARIGKVAPDWEARDVDGKVHRLVDYRGKVVVLDFWYRNCGWCIHAMPQVARLSETFRDEPVAVLGMTTDEKEEDAKVVARAMGLKYPTIKAGDIPEKHGVHTYPTLIVIDKAGKVKEIHVGYSPHLYDDLSRLIRELLAEESGG